MRSVFTLAAGAVLAFSSLTSAAPSTAIAATPAPSAAVTGTPKFVVFGDSFTDDGHGLYALSNNMLPPSPPYYEGRVSNGPTWAEQLVPSIFDFSYILKDNAVAGATAGSSDAYVQNVFNGQLYKIPNIHQQIAKYIGSDEFKTDDKEWTVYGIFIGVNDYGNMDTIAADRNVTTQDIVGQILQGATELATAGVKNIVVLNLPPVYRWPVGAPFAATPEKLIKEHNHLLKQGVAKMNNGARVELIDTHRVVSEILDHPQWFGFENTNTTCLSPTFQVCAEPDKWVFWDALHPTTKTHKLIGETVGLQIVSKLTSGKWAKSQ